MMAFDEKCIDKAGLFLFSREKLQINKTNFDLMDQNYATVLGNLNTFHVYTYSLYLSSIHTGTN